MRTPHDTRTHTHTHTHHRTRTTAHARTHARNLLLARQHSSFIRGYEVIGDQFNSGGEDDVFSSSRSRVRS
jgi:hypothetical protein